MQLVRNWSAVTASDYQSRPSLLVGLLGSICSFISKCVFVFVFVSGGVHRDLVYEC